MRMRNIITCVFQVYLFLYLIGVPVVGIMNPIDSNLHILYSVILPSIVFLLIIILVDFAADNSPLGFRLDWRVYIGYPNEKLRTT